jgi:hypothetical protein
MRKSDNDITGRLISSDYVFNNIYSLFPESVFLNSDFTIFGMSINISNELGYNVEELKGKPVSYLEKSGQMSDLLTQRLRSGVFNNEVVSIVKKSGGSIKYSVSGFYLGLLVECSNVIVLRFVNSEQVNAIEYKLKQTKNQIDNFIYRTAHDLRGPLATMQGLINLLKMRTDDSEVDRFVHMMDVHGTTLGDRLNQLVYLAKAEETLDQPAFDLRIDKLETEIRKVIERQAFIDFLDFIIVSKKRYVLGYNETLIKSALVNLVLYILSLPANEKTNLIKIELQDNFGWLKITIRFEGFECDNTIADNLSDIHTARYVDLLQSSRYTYLFAAQKIALQLKAVIAVDFITQKGQQLSIVIPNDLEATATQEISGLINKTPDSSFPLFQK